MSEEFAYKDREGRWVGGYPTRRAAIEAGADQTRRNQIITAPLDPESPAYFARFEARAVLSAMISGLENGVEMGKVVEVDPAVARLKTILSASPIQASTDHEAKLQRDLMAKLQAAVEGWLAENQIDFPPPKFVRVMEEELHLAGTNLDIPLL